MLIQATRYCGITLSSIDFVIFTDNLTCKAKKVLICFMFS